MIAQDTGGAIKGAVRGDVFWGYGADAEAQAGAMQSRGQYFVLLPNPRCWTVKANAGCGRVISPLMQGSICTA